MSIPEKYKIYEPEEAWFLNDYSSSGTPWENWPIGSYGDYSHWLTDPNYVGEHDFRMVEYSDDRHTKYMAYPLYPFGLVGQLPHSPFMWTIENPATAVYIDFGTDPNKVPTKGKFFYYEVGTNRSTSYSKDLMRNGAKHVIFDSSNINDGKLILEIPPSEKGIDFCVIGVDSVAGPGTTFNVKEIKFLVDKTRSVIGSTIDFTPPHTKTF